MPKSKTTDGQRNVVVGSEEAASVGSQAAYERLLSEARQVPAGQVIPLRSDLHLAVHNAALGAGWLADCTAEQKRSLPNTDFNRLARLGEVGLAALFADGLISRGSSGALQGKLERARTLRGVLLSSSESLSAAGLIPAAEVQKIKAGTGPLDAASDCVALAALFKKYAAQIKGKHPVTKDQLEEAAQVGTDLLLVLKPSSAKRAPSSNGGNQAVQDRDRLWTLLVQGHEELWRAGAYLFGPALVDQKVPPLQARQGVRKSTKKPQDNPTPPKS